jgi:predicted xylose isomerase-like sugar epimerase
MTKPLDDVVEPVGFERIPLRVTSLLAWKVKKSSEQSPNDFNILLVEPVGFERIPLRVTSLLAWKVKKSSEQSPNDFNILLVEPVGFEPTTKGLRVLCSTN